jgi:hypothetical protein
MLVSLKVTSAMLRQYIPISLPNFGSHPPQHGIGVCDESCDADVWAGERGSRIQHSL